MITSKTANHNNSNQPISFKGRVDKSVYKYVKNLKNKTKEVYQRAYAEVGLKQLPRADKLIDKRCDDALRMLEIKAELLHKDTVIKVSNNPRYNDRQVYLCAENKNLVQEWEQTGAVNNLTVYKNNLSDMNSKSLISYDENVSRLEYLANQLNPEKLDKRMVRTSISNIWNVNLPTLLKGRKAKKMAWKTQKVANEIGYPTTFYRSFINHIMAMRAQFNPNSKESLFSRITNLFS